MPSQTEPQILTSSSISRRAIIIARLAWEFTESNMFTFIVPNTLFGIASALSGPVLVDMHQPLPPSIAQQLLVLGPRLPLVFLFNFVNLLNFDLSNQRHPESVAEDKANKPWRPLPTGKVTPEQTRRALHITVPLALIINLALGVWHEGLFIEVLVWYYNDLRGSDELFRDAIIAVAYGLFNQGSLRVAAYPHTSINWRGHVWTAMISSVILTTMHIQDLKDQRGDRQRGRKTIPLFFGDIAARRALSVFVPLWSIIGIAKSSAISLLPFREHIRSQTMLHFDNRSITVDKVILL
ncbi:Digeranylgeranylglyceryl phosphate synthase [Cytospora mali]|uniref:Digeranylgeranylglyceryl phosphate synthase n=1 Tax=Cytospora mali TaxID=578113 RepID=A0A194W9G2_CYTMA|nr:Digeranylgeranylglyceryl phosphate synthase [Valsa mali]